VKLGLPLLAVLGSGCLARSLAVDTQTIDVTWSFTTNDFGCTSVREGLPMVRIRAGVQNANPDDELFDWVPCYVEPLFVGDPATHGYTTPLELGSYDISVELWDRIGGSLLGRSPDPAPTAVLADPLTIYQLPITIVPL
jgi:hypothetical protein